jgi:hypothetical protein
MWPTQFGGIAASADVWLTEARNDHEVPHVLERAVGRPAGPMPDAPGVWLSSLDATLLPVRRRW